MSEINGVQEDINELSLSKYRKSPSIYTSTDQGKQYSLLSLLNLSLNNEVQSGTTEDIKFTTGDWIHWTPMPEMDRMVEDHMIVRG